MPSASPYIPTVAVIGGGAAGFFGAISLLEIWEKEGLPQPPRVILLEKTGKLLAKVLVSGGGRCNVTHHCFEPGPLAAQYPRGQKELKKAFYHFQAKDIVAWFAQKEIKLKTEADGRMFPVTNTSETIANCLLDTAHDSGIEIRTHSGVHKIETYNSQFALSLNGGETLVCDAILAACGGHPKAAGYDLWEQLGHTIVNPVPSLFTFNVPGNPVTGLSGVSHPAKVHISGTSYSFSGPVLITHWGFSGPAILKLSAWAAIYLAERNYHFDFYINWAGEEKEDGIRQTLTGLQSGKKQTGNSPVYELPSRLWLYLLNRAGIPADKRWCDLNKKDINRLTNEIGHCTFTAQGKSTYKEEFVTCGGISLQDIHFADMSSRKVPGLFFAGEIMDVDGITGGFNFQHAWTSGRLAGEGLVKYLREKA